MKNLLKKFILLLPFTFLLFFNHLAERVQYDLKIVKIAIIITASICLVSLLITFIIKVFSYNSIGFTLYCCFLSLLSFIDPDLLLFMSKSTALGVFITMFILCLISLFTKFPYAAEFGRMIRPASVWSTKAFIRSNIILTVIWLLISGFCLVISLIPDSFITDKIRAIFIGFFYIAGIISNVVVVKIMRKKYDEGNKDFKFNFSSVQEMLKRSPERFNKNASKNEHIIYQYHITGSEKFDCFIEIKDQTCKYFDGIHPKPTCEIFTEAEAWKDIYSGKISGAKAYFKKLYRLKGDSSVLQKLGTLIPTIKNYKEISSMDGNNFIFPEKYQSIISSKIKNIIVLDGGPRGEKYSKTTMVAKAFCNGASASGAKVNYIFLKDKKIDHCRGCFHCWTKTPGKCIINDDMNKINYSIRESDLVVFATPLYRYGYSSLLKACIDRTLPLLKPYIIKHENILLHPVRYEDSKKEQGVIVFSASGFPELKIFNGLSKSLQILVEHSPVFKLLAEFYIPAGESLSLPFFKDRKAKILEASEKAGNYVVKKGKVSFDYMKAVSEFFYSKETFMERGNSFWELMENKNEFFDVMPGNN